MPNDPLDPEFAAQGPTAKPGQVVPPTNLPAQFAAGREAMIQEGAELTGAADVSRVLSGETPWTEAIERTSRITGEPPAEVVRRGIVRAEMPLYGAAGVIGVQQMMSPSDDASVALGAGAQ